MSKELTPLESLENIEKEVEDFEGFDENTCHQMDRARFVVIKNALKEKESWKQAYLKLKTVFEIVEEYKVDIYSFRMKVRRPNDEFSYTEYVKHYECFSKHLLIQRDFDLLKETLGRKESKHE